MQVRHELRHLKSVGYSGDYIFTWIKLDHLPWSLLNIAPYTAPNAQQATESDNDPLTALA